MQILIKAIYITSIIDRSPIWLNRTSRASPSLLPSVHITPTVSQSERTGQRFSNRYDEEGDTDGDGDAGGHAGEREEGGALEGEERVGEAGAQGAEPSSRPECSKSGRKSAKGPRMFGADLPLSKAWETRMAKRGVVNIHGRAKINTCYPTGH
ncbi:hypothetical protein RhiJN_20857 [Ceratobasidium sp. AG-Ba]|nr:hypothetical protein RhiJN_20857 [Ceratobasidium sp. AG-Ba]